MKRGCIAGLLQLLYLVYALVKSWFHPSGVDIMFVTMINIPTNTAERVHPQWQHVKSSDMSSGWDLSGKLRSGGRQPLCHDSPPPPPPEYKTAGLLKSVHTDRMRSPCYPSARPQTLKVRLHFTHCWFPWTRTDEKLLMQQCSAVNYFSL